MEHDRAMTKCVLCGLCRKRLKKFTKAFCSGVAVLSIVALVVTHQVLTYKTFGVNTVQMGQSGNEQRVTIGPNVASRLLKSVNNFGMSDVTSEHSVREITSKLNNVEILSRHSKKGMQSQIPEYNHQSLCNTDDTSIPYLSELHIDPVSPVSLVHGVTRYSINVSYATMVVKIFAVPSNCHCVVRLEDSSKMGVVNYTVGLGENKVGLMLIDTRYPNSFVVNTYDIYIFRESPRESEFLEPSGMPVCKLQQDCRVRYSPDEPCGLQSTGFRFWSEIKQVKAALPTCSRADIQSQWFVPCHSCSRPASCIWRHAIWQPDDCTYKDINTQHARICLKNKKLLFFGDSTNRGMMYTLMHTVNISLTEWAKTHSTKIYHNLNDGSTSMGFSYYPKFWLSTENKPSFEEGLTRLVERSFPLENSPQTILVVGGVQWLTMQHINSVNRVLSRNHLTSIQVIIKSLSSGFHLPIEGLPVLDQAGFQRISAQNSVVSSQSMQYGYQVLDLFNMTVSRYRDFQPGKCACHFHKVVENLPHHPGQTSHYEVVGDVNKVYSNMLMNVICRLE